MAKLKTGRHTSALKKVRQIKKQTSHNSGLKKRIKEVAKKFIESLDKGDLEKSKKLLQEVFSKWDKASKSGAIHKKTADRKKSRLSKLIGKKSK